jgi:Spy/CpxP family protein refolding chaperone
MVRLSFSPRAQAILVLALAATLGALIGILGDRFLAGRHADARMTVERSGPPRGALIPGMRYSEGLAARLDLTSEQRARIDSILADNRVRARELSSQFQPQFRALAEDTRDRVEAVLTLEQREQLSTMRQQRMRRSNMRPGLRGAGRADSERGRDTMRQP